MSFEMSDQMEIIPGWAGPYIELEGMLRQPSEAEDGERVEEWIPVSCFAIYRNGSIHTFEVGKSVAFGDWVYRKVPLRGPTWCQWHRERLAVLKKMEKEEHWDNIPMSRGHKDEIARLREFRNTYRKKSWEV